MLVHSTRQTDEGHVDCELLGSVVAETAGTVRAMSDGLSVGSAVITLDLVGVDELDVSGLGALLGLVRLARRRSGKVVVRASERTRGPLNRAGLTRLVELV